MIKTFKRGGVHPSENKISREAALYMKPIKLMFCIALCLAFCNCNSQTGSKKSDLQRANLKGKVKSVRIIWYDIVEKSGEPTKSEIVGERYMTYNDKGNKIEDIEYDSDDSMRWKVVYKYDDKGHVIEQNNYTSDGNWRYKCIPKYDDKGIKIEQNSYDSDGSLSSKDVYKYDDKGNVIEQNSYDSDGSLGCKFVYKCDNKGYLIERNIYIYNSNDSSFHKYVYKYDDKGNQIEENSYDSDGSLDKSVYKYKYDEHDNWIERQEYKEGKIETITERKIEYYK